MSLPSKLIPGLGIFIVASTLFISFGCQSSIDTEITYEEASVLLDRYMETMTESDMALIDEIISPEFVLRSPMFPEPIVGIEGYKALVTNTARTFSDFTATIDEIVVHGDQLWGRFSMSGTNTGPLGELPPTNKSFSITGLAVTRVADGMIVEDETFWNVLDLYQQLGFTLTPPPGQQ
ncbi:MAG: hypothetical protein BMS9Abin05_2436 [Rhodothermia bacterium]|nr:MAG: hypothetical protein BMS9Abin05_2436 [Rhodothermia bacterium]